MRAIPDQYSIGELSHSLVQMLSLYLLIISLSLVIIALSNVPLVVNGLNDKAKCGAHGMNVFIHDLFDDRRLACIVQSAVQHWVSVESP